MSTATSSVLERQRVPFDFAAREASVVTVEELSPRMRRFTLVLAEGSAPVGHVARAVGTHVKVAFPHPHTGELHLPQVVDGRPHRPEGAPRPVLRDYTVRAVPERGRLVLDFVIHGSGPASTWAAQAGPGDRVGILGPRGAVVEPDNADRYVVLVDESGMPAAARWLEEIPGYAALHLAIHLTSADARVDLPEHPGATVTWITDPAQEALAQHLRTLTPAAGDYVWAAGEAGSMVQVRAAAAEVGFGQDDGPSPSAVRVDGYWRRGVAGRDHHAPLDE